VFSPPHVLVVDDEPDVRETLIALLSGFGYLTTSAATARVALDLWATDGPFDIVLTDISMPDINGILLAEMLREGFPDLPVILMTGRHTLVDRLLEASTVALVKPFTALQLKEVIDDALASRR